MKKSTFRAFLESVKQEVESSFPSWKVSKKAADRLNLPSDQIRKSCPTCGLWSHPANWKDPLHKVIEERDKQIVEMSNIIDRLLRERRQLMDQIKMLTCV